MKSYLLILILCWSQLLSAEIYQWTDENGNVHFGDRPSANVEKQTVDIYVGKDAVVNKNSIPRQQIQNRFKQGVHTNATSHTDVTDVCSNAYAKMRSFAPQWVKMVKSSDKARQSNPAELNHALSSLENFGSVSKQDFVNSCKQEYTSVGKALVDCLANAADAASSAICMSLNL